MIHCRSVLRLTAGMTLPEMSIVIPRLPLETALFPFFFLKAFSFCLCSLIGGNDVLYETVTNNILLAEKNEFDVIDVLENLLRFFQTGPCPGW